MELYGCFVTWGTQLITLICHYVPIPSPSSDTSPQSPALPLRDLSHPNIPIPIPNPIHAHISSPVPPKLP
jgi:hypothetical protein